MLRPSGRNGYSTSPTTGSNQDLRRPGAYPPDYPFPPLSRSMPPHDPSRPYAPGPASNGAAPPYHSSSSPSPSTSTTPLSTRGVNTVWRQAFLPSAIVVPPPLPAIPPPHLSPRPYAPAHPAPPAPDGVDRGRLAAGSPFHMAMRASPYGHHHHPHPLQPLPPPLPFEAARSPPPPPPSHIPPPPTTPPPPPPPPSEPEHNEQDERRGTKRKLPEEPAPAAVEGNFKCERDLSRFEKLGKLEEGAFGVVYRAKDKDSGQVVALKKMKRRKEEHEEGVPLSVLREIKIGVQLQGNVNIINIRDIIFEEHDDWEDAKDGKKFKDESSSGEKDKEKEKEKEEERKRVRKGKGKEIYLVMDFIDHDLGRLLKEMRERKEVFVMTEIKSLLYQLLSAIAHMHSLGIIHRDIKTNNLLLGHDGILRLTDFGLSREYYMSENNDKKKNKDEWAQMNGENGMLYTPTVVTLRYRSMELLLGVKEYTTAIDMWSCGVIFAELINGGSFFKSHLEIEQIYEIIELLGTPTERHWPGMARLDVVRKKKIIFPHQPHNLLHKRFGGSLSRSGFDLLSRMLHYNPDKRISAAEALAHPFFTEEPLPQRPAPRYYASKW